MEVSEVTATLAGMGRCVDGSDQSIFSTSIAQAAVIKGINRMKSIAPVKINVALKGNVDPAAFTFSRTWCVPLLFVKLSAGQRALLNVIFLVADNETAC